MRARQQTSWWKTFLKPSWVFLLLFVIVFSYLAFTVLAPWQLGKDDDIVERNEHITAAYEKDPVPADEILDENGAIAGGEEWSRVILRGRYIPDDEVLVRLRPVASGPSYQSLVPFRTDGGQTILVNRGWVPAGEANAVPEIAPAPSGPQEVVGMVRQHEAEHSSAPVERDGYPQVHSINPPQVGELIDADLGADYVQLTEDQPGVLNPIPIPQMDRGNHLSYGFQWIAFGIMAPLGLGYFVWAEIRERRRVRDEEAEMAQLDAAEEHAAPAAGSATGAAAAAEPETADSKAEAAAEAHERRMRARYGDSKPDFYSKFAKRNKERF
ncbi:MULTISPECIES: SURF1 family protein [unclassified Corynebacterium]|uniref:SURF1 family cytochrome oxidase biogenesis protein n=1 Tax=unclassified Corynebacterium TaxID=2624378 RepID=UPI0034CFCA57